MTDSHGDANGNPQANIPLDGIQSGPVDVSSPIDLGALKDQTIVITGGASGLGAAFARHWARNGANVIIGDVDVTRGESLIANLRTATANGNHHFVGLDVTSWTSQLRFFEQAVRLSPHGGIDTVVANAGVSLADESLAFENPVDYHARSSGKVHPPSLSDPPQYRTLDVNLTGVLYTTHLAQSYLPRNPSSRPCSPKKPKPKSATDDRRDRHILLISSLAGLSPLPTQSLYSISKHGVVGLFRNLRVTCPIRHGIRVNMLCPYFVDTEILGHLGRVVMAGAGMADLDHVVEAASRLVCDRGVVGRGLAVGPESESESDGVGVLVAGGGGKAGMAVWEVYAHDFEQSDVFSRRMVAVTNLVAGRRGFLGLLRDLAAFVFGGIFGNFWGLWQRS